MTKRILFVDDDDNLLQTIKRTLRMKYENVIADFENLPANAIKKIDKYNYNIIVTGYKMSGINGETLLNIVKERKPDIIRIVLTGYIDDALKSDMCKDPRIYFIKKPVVIDELMSTIEKAMNDS